MNIFLNEKILISNGDWVSGDINEINDNIDTLLKSLNCFNYYIEPNVYYTATGIENLFRNFTALDSLTDYMLSNPVDKFRMILNDIGALNWDTIKKQRTDKNYYYLEGMGAFTHYVNGTSIAEATEYKFEGEKVALLNLSSSDHNASPIHILRGDVNPPNLVLLFPLPIIVSKSDTIAYILKEMEKRVFNLNPKHGENGINVRHNKGETVSPLDCSKEQAANLLITAVGLKTTNELYAYDDQIGKFIVFKYENTPENSYHAYHPINQNEVPKEIKDFLNAF